MSNEVYPTLPGLSFPVKRTPVFKNIVSETSNGREYRTALMLYPKVKYSLKYEFLSDADFRTIVGFFNARRGAYDSFLFLDPEDSVVTAQTIGVGDGSTKQFQLIRTLGGFAEPIYDVKTFTGLYVNGTLQPSGGLYYSVSNTGLITFITAPANGAVISWTGEYYWRCRFKEDSLDVEKFMHQLWQAGKVEFQVVKP